MAQEKRMEKKNGNQKDLLDGKLWLPLAIAFKHKYLKLNFLEKKKFYSISIYSFFVRDGNGDGDGDGDLALC